MFRSRAGDPEVLDKVLCRGPHHAGDDDPVDDPTRNDDDETAGAGLVSSCLLDHHHNAHWLPGSEDDTGGGGGPSRYVAYYDAASLYPSSGEPTTHTHTHDIRLSNAVV